VSEAYKEPGCEMYDLVESKGDEKSSGEDTWVMMEKWSSKALWDDHMLTAHVKHINSIDKKYFRQPTELRLLHPVFPN
jgi:quinol monooxygenase YgiN